MEKYSDLPMDLADGTLVTLAESQGIKKAFTLDHKDFRIYKPAYPTFGATPALTFLWLKYASTPTSFPLND